MDGFIPQGFLSVKHRRLHRSEMLYISCNAQERRHHKNYLAQNVNGAKTGGL